MTILKGYTIAALAAAIASLGSVSLAQDRVYPGAAVRLIVPSSAGAGQDVAARFVADNLSRLWGEPVIVENVPGAGGVIANSQVARTEADGLTLLWNSTTFAMQAAMDVDPSVDMLADFSPIASVGTTDLVLVAGNRFPIATLDELIAASADSTIFAVTRGPGAAATMYASLLENVLNVEWQHVDYQGLAEGMIDLVAGRTDVTVGSIPSVISHLESSTLSPIAVLSAERSPILPDVPTIAELGYPDGETTLWWGLWAPAGTSEAIVAQIAADVATIMAMPEAEQTFDQLGAAPRVMDTETFTTFVENEIAQWSRIAEATAD